MCEILVYIHYNSSVLDMHRYRQSHRTTTRGGLLRQQFMSFFLKSHFCFSFFSFFGHFLSD